MCRSNSRILRFEHPQLSRLERQDTRVLPLARDHHSGQRRHRATLRHLSANRRNDPKLGKMGTDRIDHGSLLANEEVPGAVEHQAALLLGRLCLYEAHVWSHNGFADRLSIGSIVLLAFEVGLHIGRRHQPNGMTERPQLARPMM